MRLFSLGFPASYRYVPAARDLMVAKDEFKHLPSTAHGGLTVPSTGHAVKDGLLDKFWPVVMRFGLHISKAPWTTSSAGNRPSCLAHRVWLFLIFAKAPR